MLPFYWWRGWATDSEPLRIFLARARFTPIDPTSRPFGIVPFIRTYYFKARE